MTRWISFFVAVLLSFYFLVRSREGRTGKAALRRLREHTDAGAGVPVREKRAATRVAERIASAAYFNRLAEEYRASGAGISWARFKALWACCAVGLPLLTFAAGGSAITMPLALSAALIMPFPLMKTLKRRNDRKAAVEVERLAGELALHLRCGIPVTAAIDLCAPDFMSPLGEHISAFKRRVRAGTSPEGALRELAESLGDSDLQLIAEAAVTSKETGAELAGVMSAVGDALRERAAIRRELFTQTVQGRLSGQIVAALPLVFLLFSALVSRDTLSVVFGTAHGLMMLGAALLMDLVGFLWIRRILEIDA